MRKLVQALVLCLAVSLVAAGCGKEQRVGSEKALDFDEQENAKRLGEAEATPEPVATDAGTLALGQQATPAPVATAAPTPAPRFFDVSMVADSPFYEPGNALVTLVGVTLRVTNKDTDPLHKGRSFYAEDNSFDSGPLEPGQTWTHKFTAPGQYTIRDAGLNFARATLEVRAG